MEMAAGYISCHVCFVSAVRAWPEGDRGITHSDVWCADVKEVAHVVERTRERKVVQ
jgi:hypothetical protein